MVKFFLGIVVIVFFIFGGVIDYWQSARHHHKPIPNYLEKYFAFFWLFAYTGVLPLLIAYAASGFKINTALMYTGFALIGMVCWDMVYSLLDQKKLISSQIDYFYWKNKDYQLTKKQIAVWHLIRLLVGLLLIFKAI